MSATNPTEFGETVQQPIQQPSGDYAPADLEPLKAECARLREEERLACLARIFNTPAQPPAPPDRIEDLEQKIQDLEDRLDALE